MREETEEEEEERRGRRKGAAAALEGTRTREGSDRIHQPQQQHHVHGLGRRECHLITAPSANGMPPIRLSASEQAAHPRSRGKCGGSCHERPSQADKLKAPNAVSRDAVVCDFREDDIRTLLAFKGHSYVC